MRPGTGAHRVIQIDLMHIQSRNEVCLLTGGSDRPYVFGLTTALIPTGASIELIGSDELEFPEFQNLQGLKFFNLRGSTESGASSWAKALRIAKYYFRLICYASTARPRVFHILWNNKFEYFDRTLLMLFYQLLGKKVVVTVHNVNTKKRDLSDGFLNRLTLRIQYGLAHHLFVHTEKMKQELIDDFHVRGKRVSVIPFGINNAVPQTSLRSREAKEDLKLAPEHKAILFFGRITPYKGLDWLIPIFRSLISRDRSYRLIIAGRPDRCEGYWNRIRSDIQKDVQSGMILLNDSFIPDDRVEVYFKAADALILPYRDIYQSGVLFLGQSFGLPVLASGAGSLKDDVADGENGFVFELENADRVEQIIERYFSSDLYKNLYERRVKIRQDAIKRHSWDEVARTTLNVYSNLVPDLGPGNSSDKDKARTESPSIRQIDEL